MSDYKDKVMFVNEDLICLWLLPYYLMTWSALQNIVIVMSSSEGFLSSLIMNHYESLITQVFRYVLKTFNQVYLYAVLNYSVSDASQRFG